MPVLPYSNCLEPAKDAAIWRFMDLRKFRDLMASEELYLRRADLFNDKSEGLPPEDYAMGVLGLNPYDLRDRAAFNCHLGSLAQHRESYYISCWHLFRQETLDMWEQYGHDGVAVCSRYELLKAAMDGQLDAVHFGMVQYGTGHLRRSFNALEFITTKQTKYAADCEVRALLTAYDPLASGNRHFDLENVVHPAPLAINPRHSWVPDCKRRRIDLKSLVTDVVLSPWAQSDTTEEIRLWVKTKGFPSGARPSDLATAITPTLDEFRRFRHIASTRLLEPEIVDETRASSEELERFEEVLSALPVNRVRFLYRQRWEACRLNPGDIPRLADVQFLETALRTLDDWRRQGVGVS